MNKKIIISFVLSFLLFFGFGLISHAQSVKDTLNGLNSTAQTVPAFQGQTKNTYTSAFVAGYAGNIIGIILSFVGVLFLGLMIYSGLMWMLAEGNEEKINDAKQLIINALIGLIVVFAAYALTIFIGKNFLS